MFKRVSSVVMVVAMLLTMLCTFSFASAEGTPMSLTLTAKNGVDVKRGDTVILTVGMKDYTAANLMAIAGEYDSAVLTDAKASKGELGAPVFNAKTLYSSWAQADNFVVEDDDFNALSEFTLVSFRFTVAADAPFGETTVKVYFAQEDANGSKNTNAYYDGTTNVVMTPGVDYVAEPVTITLNVACTVDHSTITEWTAPAAGTAKADAKHTAECSGCGDTLEEACSFVAEGDAACNEPGTEKCTVCGYTVETAGALGHDWTDWENVEGETKHQRTCKRAGCNEVETEDCDLDEVTTPATCEEDGKKVTTCTECDYEDVETIPALGHNYVYTGDNTQDPEGTHTHKCTNEGCDVVDEECNFYIVVKELTCIEDGEYACDCGHTVVYEATGDEHTDLVIIYKAPTDTVPGTITVKCKSCDTEIGTEETPVEPYADLKAEDGIWYYDAATFNYIFGELMVGEYDNFNGDNAITRGQVVTVLGRYLFSSYGGDEYIASLTVEELNAMMDSAEANLGLTVGELTDLKVEGGDYYDRYALLLAHMGIVMGHDDGEFKGDDLVTREELACFMTRFVTLLDVVAEEFEMESRALDENAPFTFADIDTVSAWAKDAVVEAGEIGLFAGKLDNKFDPTCNATRAEMATLMEKIMRAYSVFEIVDAE
ncbi:MAG: S-layer homology domain-containing protein [Clostridia bacterium]|nr:S-layer homology domain-containing protein [Clostridia bacterium]